MCIIGYCPKGKTISDKRLEIMFLHNPDGAGIMWKPKDGPIEIRKGFMTFKELLDAWHLVPFGCEKAVHCRIASHGKINPQNCHPFPVRENIDTLSKLTDEEHEVIMHNGIIGRTSPLNGKNAKYSDTMIFASHILANVKNLDDEYMKENIVEYIGWSRLLIFRDNAKTLMLGSWEKADGCYFSNGSFREYRECKSCWTPPKSITTNQLAPTIKVTKSAKKDDQMAHIQALYDYDDYDDYDGYGDINWEEIFAEIDKDC